MKHTRIVITQYGGPDELRVIEEERPEPKHGEARVRVLAAGVCLPDVMMRLRPSLFRQDLGALFDLLEQQKIKPLIAQRLPLAEARRAGAAGEGGCDRQDRARGQRAIGRTPGA